MNWPALVYALALGGNMFALPLRAQSPMRVSNPNPMDSIAKLPGYRSAYDTTPLPPAARIAAVDDAASWPTTLRTYEKWSLRHRLQPGSQQ